MIIKKGGYAAFFIYVTARPLNADEIVLCVDEKTSLQSRPGNQSTKPALPGNKPNLLEHEYKRAGALQLLAGLDTRTGIPYGQCHGRKRRTEFIPFLEYLYDTIRCSLKNIRITYKY